MQFNAPLKKLRAFLSIRTGLVLIIVALMGLALSVLMFPPKPKPKAQIAPSISVNTQSIAPTSFQIELRSYGTVRPRTQSDLVAQVEGMITEINTQFRSGGFFDAGEILLVIDPRDYEVTLLAREAELADAKQALLLEQARSTQAAEDWRNLGKTEAPSDLVLRKPQLASMQARLQSAEAAVQRAHLDLDRTRVKAPYAGRMLEKKVDLGQVVTKGAVLGMIYASNHMEVRLPLRNQDIAFIDLPEPRPLDENIPGDLPEVGFYSSLSQESWRGHVVRTESALDASSHQLYVIAQIEDPYRIDTQKSKPPKIGEYVNAIIKGRIVNDAIVVNNDVIYQNSFVYLIEEGLVRHRDIEILWHNDQQSLIKSGLAVGDLLVLNRLGEYSNGYKAVISSLETPQGRSGHNGLTEDRVSAPQ